MRALEREELEYEARLAVLYKALDEGDASGIAEDGVPERVCARLAVLAQRQR